MRDLMSSLPPTGLVQVQCHDSPWRQVIRKMYKSSIGSMACNGEGDAICSNADPKTSLRTVADCRLPNPGTKREGRPEASPLSGDRLIVLATRSENQLRGSEVSGGRGCGDVERSIPRPARHHYARAKRRGRHGNVNRV